MSALFLAAPLSREEATPAYAGGAGGFSVLKIITVLTPNS